MHRRKMWRDLGVRRVYRGQDLVRLECIQGFRRWMKEAALEAIPLPGGDGGGGKDGERD